MKNGIKIGLITCLLALLACKDTTKSEDPKLYEGTYTLASITLVCEDASNLTADPPNGTGSLTIKTDGVFNWTTAVIDDNVGTFATCTGGSVDAFSFQATGTVSEASGILTFNAGTKIVTYRWIKTGKNLTLTDTEGDDIYKFTEI